MSTETDIRPRIVDGEPVCAPLTCPCRERCASRMTGIMEANKPCIPSLRREVDRLREQQGLVTMSGEEGAVCREFAGSQRRMAAEILRLRGGENGYASP
jgi:hypothetical protein